MILGVSKSDSYIVRKALRKKLQSNKDKTKFPDTCIFDDTAKEASFLPCSQVLPFDDFCDIDIKLEQEIYKAHRAILTQHSTYFSKVLEKLPSTLACLDLSKLCDITPAVLPLVLQWMYTGRTSITMSNVHALLKAAHTLGITGLSTRCYDFLSKLCQRRGPMVIQEEAEALNLDFTKAFAQNYRKTHFLELIHGPHFTKYHLFQVIDLLSKGRTPIIREKMIFNAAIRWLKADWLGRHKWVREVMDCIHFSIMPTSDLRDCCKPGTAFIVQHPAVLPRFLGAMLYRMTRKTSHKWQYPSEDQLFHLAAESESPYTYSSPEESLNFNTASPLAELSDSSLRQTKSEVILRT